MSDVKRLLRIGTDLLTLGVRRPDSFPGTRTGGAVLRGQWSGTPLAME
jgi:hypothetical protein